MHELPIAIFRSNKANETLINSSSVEDIAPVDSDEQTSSSPRLRNRYLKRVGVADSEDEDDFPLLSDADRINTINRRADEVNKAWGAENERARRERVLKALGHE